MTRINKTWLQLITALVVGGGVYWFLFRPAAIQVAKIAVAIPQSGEDAISGAELKAGLDLMRMEIQKGDLLPHDYRPVIEIHDDRSTEAGARAAAYAIASDPNVIAVVGHFSSANTLSALPIYRNAGLPVIMPVATLTTITESGQYPNAFRLPPNNELQAQTVAAFIVERLKFAQFFMISDDTEYARNLAFSIENSLRNHRVQLVGIETIPRGTQNFPILAALAAFDPPLEAIIFVGYSPEAVYLARQLKLSGHLEATLVCTDGVYGTRFRDSDGADGAYVIYQVPPKEQLNNRDQWRRYATEFERRNPAMNPEGWAAWSYDALGIAHSAIRASLRLGRVPRATHVISVLQGSADSTPFEYRGVLGDYEFDRHGDNRHGHYHVYKVVNGEYVWQWSYGSGIKE